MASGICLFHPALWCTLAIAPCSPSPPPQHVSSGFQPHPATRSYSGESTRPCLTSGPLHILFLPPEILPLLFSYLSFRSLIRYHLIRAALPDPRLYRKLLLCIIQVTCAPPIKTFHYSVISCVRLQTWAPCRQGLCLVCIPVTPSPCSSNTPCWLLPQRLGAVCASVCRTLT